MPQLSKSSFSRLACALTLLAASTVSFAVPVTVEYALSSLAAPGRYQYTYTVTNVSLSTPVGWFSVDFDPTLYDETSLLITSTGSGDWSEQLLSSIPILDVPAQYDAYKTSGSPLGIGESEGGFTIEFTWLGAGTPGSQAFTVYDTGTLDVLDAGLTSLAAAPPPPSGVPEPTSLALVLLALGGTAAAGRHSGRRPTPQPLPKSSSSTPIAQAL